MAENNPNSVGFIAIPPGPHPRHPSQMPDPQLLPYPIQQQPSVDIQRSMQWFYNSNFETYLRGASMLRVDQKMGLEFGFEAENEYTVKDQFGNKIFYVREESNCCARNFFGGFRSFKLTVNDAHRQDVLRMDRDLDCSCCCALICPDSITVSTANGELLGRVEEKFHLFLPKFDIKDAAGNVRLKIEGPFCKSSCCCNDVVFRLLNPDGVQVGSVDKKFSGFVKEMYAGADNFEITFPSDLEPSIKAVCLGALFLIDYKYFTGKPLLDE